MSLAEAHPNQLTDQWADLCKAICQEELELPLAGWH